jgi:hypothetical protein
MFTQLYFLRLSVFIYFYTCVRRTTYVDYPTIASVTLGCLEIHEIYMSRSSTASESLSIKVSIFMTEYSIVKKLLVYCCLKIKASASLYCTVVYCTVCGCGRLRILHALQDRRIWLPTLLDYISSTNSAVRIYRA